MSTSLNIIPTSLNINNQLVSPQITAQSVFVRKLNAQFINSNDMTIGNITYIDTTNTASIVGNVSTTFPLTGTGSADDPITLSPSVKITRSLLQSLLPRDTSPNWTQDALIVDSATSNTLTVAVPFVQNWANFTILITSGSSQGQGSRIVSNTLNTLTLDPPLQSVPSLGDYFMILPPNIGDLFVPVFFSDEPITFTFPQTITKICIQIYKALWDATGPQSFPNPALNLNPGPISIQVYEIDQITPIQGISTSADLSAYASTDLIYYTFNVPLPPNTPFKVKFLSPQWSVIPDFILPLPYTNNLIPPPNINNIFPQFRFVVNIIL